MSATYTLVLRPARKDGLCPMHLRLTSDRQPTYRAIAAVVLSPQHQNAKGTLEKHNLVRKSHPYCDRYNEALRKLMR